MNLTRRDFIKGAVVLPAVASAVVIAAPSAGRTTDWPPIGPSPKQHAAIDSEARFIMVTGSRGSGKSWTLQRIAENEAKRGEEVGVIFGSYAAGQDWRFKRAAVKLYHPDDLMRGLCPRILIVDNAEFLSKADFAQIAAARLFNHSYRIILAAMPHGEHEGCFETPRNWSSRRDFLLRNFESHHLGSVFDNPHLMADSAYAVAIRNAQ